MPAVDPDALLPSSQAAALLSVRPQTMRKWRLTGRGPTYVRFGGPFGRVAYRRADLDAWISERRFTSTAAEAVSAPAPVRP